MARLPAARSLRSLLARAARAVFRHHDIEAAELSLTLLDDEAIAALNTRWLAHEGPTDTIAFALHEPGEPPVGDVYLGVAQALRQAAELGVEPREELVRLAVHGTLHVLGYDHGDGDARMRGEMWTLQERIVREVLAA